MTLTEDQIKQILYSKDFQHLADYSAPLEVERFTGLLGDVLSQAEQNNMVRAGMPYERWSGVVKQMIVDAVQEDDRLFNDVNLSKIVDMDSLLKQIYQIQS